MSTPPTAEQGPDRVAGRRRPWLLAAAIAVVAVLVGVVVLVVGDDEKTPAAAGSTGTPAATSTSPSSASAAPDPVPAATPEPTAQQPGQPPALPAVALDQPVVLDGITGSIASIEAIDGQATGPGDVAGPALRVTVQIVNGTAEPLSLDEIAVNLAYGPDRRPASPLEDPSRDPYTGTLAVGATAEGIYVFRVPPEQREAITVEVAYRADAPLVLFAGAAG